MFDKLNATSAAFDAVQAGGATLGGSLIEFRQAAHNGYLTMGEFTNVMKNNGEAMASFGGQTAVGAREFSKANRALAGGDMGRQLKQMGFSFEDMGGTTADMMEQFALSGISFDQLAVRTGEVAKASFEQARQQKILSAITGRSIEAQKQAEKAQRKDAQVQASLARMGPEQRKQTEQLISAFPHLKDAILDQVTFGGAVSKEAMMQMSQFPNAVKSVQGAVDGIKGAIGTANDVGEIAGFIDKLFEGEKQVQQRRNQQSGVGVGDQFGVTNVAREIIFPDHYDYNHNDLKKIQNIAKNENLKIITTEKDFMKIPEEFKKEINFLTIDLIIQDEKKLIELLTK